MFRPSKLPFPESVVVTQASENDLNVFKHNWSDFSNRKFYGDKINHDTEFFVNMAEEINSTMLTPLKGVKGQPDYIKFFDEAANALYSNAVTTIRQPIEAFFNWINEKTNIQRASNVRSTNGLLVHVFRKLAAAFVDFPFIGQLQNRHFFL